MIGEEFIHHIIENALRAPSGDNVQPWRFRWERGVLKIYHMDSLARHALNRQNHASLLAFGGVLESIRLAASQFQVGVSERIFLNPAHTELWGEVRFIENGVAVDPLARMLQLRATDRGNYRGGSLQDTVFKEICDLSSEFKSCEAKCLNVRSDIFTKYFLKSEELLWKKKKIVGDLCKWLRLTKPELDSNSDGMSWESIGMNKLEAHLFRLVRIFPILPGLLWNFGFGHRIRADAKKALMSSAGLICFTTNALDSESFCRAGRMAFRAWLMLNSAGYGVQPLSYSSMSIADLRLDPSSPSFTQKERQHFLEGESVFRQEFNLEAQAVPVWMFRIGRSDRVQHKCQSKRRPVGKVLEVGANDEREPCNFALCPDFKRKAVSRSSSPSQLPGSQARIH